MVRPPLIVVKSRSLHIAVFCKPLVPGAVKTRLIPAYGADAAAGIYAQLVERSLQTVRTACAALDGSASLWVAGDAAHRSVLDWGNRFALPIHSQCAGDLGARMSQCLTTLAHHYERVLLIGTDSPALTANDLQAAAAALSASCHWVFTPAEDGGYVLVGSNRASAEPFANIAWSTSHVMAQTRNALHAGALPWTEMSTLWDVDEAADVERARGLALLAV